MNLFLNTQSYSSNFDLKTSKCELITSIASGSAGIIICLLAGLHLFGGPRSLGFIASVIGGGSLIGVSLGIIMHALRANRFQTAQPLIFDDNKRKIYEDKQNNFYAAVSDRMEGILPPLTNWGAIDQEEFQASSQEAIDYLNPYKKIPDGSPVHRFVGGEHVCIFTNQIPGVIFKKNYLWNEDTAAYVEQANKAREICSKHNLHLLYVPLSKQDKDNKNIFIQEKVDFLDGDVQNHYQWLIHDPKLQPYSKELFRQLLIFICEMQFADVKCDNIKIMKDGRVALFDLDDDGAVTGLTESLALNQGGLFRILPLEWFDEFVSLAQQHLTPDEFSELNLRLPELREEAEKRALFIQQVAAFHKSKNIISPSQPLIFNRHLLKINKPNIILFAEKIMEICNEKLANLSEVSMIKGRSVTIPLAWWNQEKRANELIPPFTQEEGITFQESINFADQAIQALQKTGCIFSIERISEGPREYIRIIC